MWLPLYLTSPQSSQALPPCSPPTAETGKGRILTSLVCLQLGVIVWFHGAHWNINGSVLTEMLCFLMKEKRHCFFFLCAWNMNVQIWCPELQQPYCDKEAWAWGKQKANLLKMAVSCMKLPTPTLVFPELNW